MNRYMISNWARLINLMHMPQWSMPQSSVCPSCPKLHPHLCIYTNQSQIQHQSNQPFFHLNPILTADPTERKNVPIISGTINSPTCLIKTHVKKKKSLIWRSVIYYVLFYYLCLPRKSEINSHGSSWSDSKAGHDCSNKVSISL